MASIPRPGGVPHTLCKFPFYYNGRRYTECTHDGFVNKPKWCSTTMDFNRDLKWGWCETEEAQKKCRDVIIDCRKLGFIWKLQVYEYNCPRSCGFCTYGGTAKGAPCKFPFIYKRKMYTGCMRSKWKAYKGTHWCGTTDNVDRDNQWGLCYSR
ncbi:matrix metalloproteinase-9 [Nematostella vectensis]|uniref:matrix metalloproteinase-9 n=1 Tax=Nematostella vectensis TaxID=45351 RepID=UPI002077341F|nr:matrix metalloproteinase-9 [Nematostella vectensis]